MIKIAFVLGVLAACLLPAAQTDASIVSFSLAYEKQMPGSTRMRLGSSPEVLYVSRTSSLDEKDIESANIQSGILRPEILITVREEAAKRLQALTASHLGDRLGIVVDGKLIAAPIIRQPIPGNQLAISGELLSEAELNRLANRIKNAANTR